MEDASGALVQVLDIWRQALDLGAVGNGFLEDAEVGERLYACRTGAPRRSKMTGRRACGMENWSGLEDARCLVMIDFGGGIDPLPLRGRLLSRDRKWLLRE